MPMRYENTCMQKNAHASYANPPEILVGYIYTNAFVFAEHFRTAMIGCN
jgi:hypothetical protein